MSPISPDSGNIFLYNGQGANPYCVQKAIASFHEYLGSEEAPRLIAADSSYIVRDLSRLGKAVIFTGGNAHTTRSDFKLEGIQSLSEAILNHECTFIGFCCGAYLAGRSFYHYENKCLKMDLGLNLIHYQHEGPAFSLGKDAENLGSKTSKIAKVNFGPYCANTSCHVYWNGGGAYESYHPLNAIQFASYEEAEFKTYGSIAGLYVTKGRGKVICTSVHPEIQLDRDEVQLWCPLMTENETELLVKDVPLQKEFLAEICNLAELKDQNPSYWTRYY